MNLEDHPTVRRLSRQVQGIENQQPAGTMLDGSWLRRLALDCGADDAGLVEIARPWLDPQLECKLCVAACPVGAIGPDGSFNFSSCFTHNYREFLGGFSDWIEQVRTRATPSNIAGASMNLRRHPCGRV
jgi:ferredoxin